MAVHITLGIWYWEGTRGIDFAEVLCLALPIAPSARILFNFGCGIGLGPREASWSL